MHILICDDDAAFGARMAEYVTVYFTARSVQVHTAVCTSAAEVLATPGLELYQLAFLDVDMPGANGMVLGRQLKQKCPGLMLVYVSAYLEFALEGYTVNAYRYLLKRDIARTLPKCLDDLLALSVKPFRVCQLPQSGSPWQSMQSASFRPVFSLWVSCHRRLQRGRSYLFTQKIYRRCQKQR